MRFQVKILTVILGIFCGAFVEAYETVTHSSVTRQALVRSSLSQESEILLNLALDLKNVEQSFITRNGATRIRVQLQSGSESEDDNERPARHFFDPISGDGIFSFAPSPSWALEDDQAHDFPVLQIYSLADAEESWYELLTLSDRQLRLDRAAFFFESLGRVVHHIQDMAQPQHTRGDIHFRHGSDNTTLPWEDPSLHERWTNKNIERLPLDQAYPIPMFPTARAFWATLDDRGMADYSNAGFVSADTNFPDSGGFPSPRLSDAEGYSVPDVRPLFEQAGIAVPTPCRDAQLPCAMLFVQTVVHDQLNREFSQVNNFTSTYSMFDDELERRGLEREFSLNRFNFDSANEFLIPRAVSYSAGLIDFLFRGKLTAEAAEREDGTVRITLTNESAEGNAFSDGQFELWYDDASDIRHQVNGVRINGTQDATLVTAFDTGNFIELEAPLPPATTAETRFLLTYRGTIGQSAGIASVSFQVEPYRSGFAVSLHDGLPIGYVSWEGNQWIFTPDAEVQTGNIDWRGAYVNGKPTKTLTWSGPTSRYFDGGQKLFTFNENVNEWRPSTFRPNVYENGRLLAVAPGPVLGAAVTRDSEEKEWLVIVTYEGPLRRVVYRRPNERSNSNALYDPVTNPDGWKEIGRYSSPPDERWVNPRSPWFFNGDGTAAQAMETVALAEDELPPARLVRVELRISGEDVTWINHGNLSDEALWVSVSSQCVANYTLNENGSVDGSGNETKLRTGRTVIAVDYLDDREILAVMNVEGMTNQTDTSDPEIAAINSSYEFFHREWMLVGTQRFDLSHADIVEEYLQPGGVGSRHELHYSWRTVRIRFMDLREGVVQLVEDIFVSDGLAELPGTQPLYTNTESTREMLVMGASPIIAMHEESTETETIFPGFRGVGQVACPAEPQWQIAPNTLYWPDFEILSTCPLCVWEFILHNHYQVGLKGSVSIDNSGKIFSSQEIIGLPPSPNVTSNYLSGAPGDSPAAVIGVGEDDWTLYEPRVIR